LTGRNDGNHDNPLAPVTSPWRWKQHGSLKCCYPTTSLHGITT